MKTQKEIIYKNLAKYYDRIFSWKNYESDANKIKLLIKKYKKSEGNNLLEVACGTGMHIQYFRDSFSILATDLNQSMLSIAQKRNPDVKFKKANMVDLNLSKKFDVILCLFASIGYVKNYKNLHKTIENFSRHLKKGGIVIIEPWFSESSYVTGSPNMTTYSDENIKISRLCVFKKKGIISITDMHYLIAERDKEVTHYIDRHELAMFDTGMVLDIMMKNELTASFLRKGLLKDRDLFIGVKK